jgi:hypothetical protein
MIYDNSFMIFPALPRVLALCDRLFYYHPLPLPVSGSSVSLGNEKPRSQSWRAFSYVRQSRPSRRFPQGGFWPNSPHGRRGALLIPEGVLRPSCSLPGGGQVASLHSPPSRRNSWWGGWALPLHDNGKSARVTSNHFNVKRIYK